MISYSLIDTELLPCTPVCSYKFHVVAVYLSEVHLESNRKSEVELLSVNGQWFIAVDYLHRRAASLMLDSILNVTLHLL